MQYAIIAAGEGSRLCHEGIAAPKPLVKVGGECLIDRLVALCRQEDPKFHALVSGTDAIA